jgi:cellulose synthase/poly-beta-1,6-N-acetylglucosamine synthase-like glycosyltransferase
MLLLVSRPAIGFSIGVCASDASPNLPSLVAFLLSEDYGDDFLRRLVVVASGCDERIVARTRALADSDQRVLLIVEPERRGKAEAINRIVENSAGEYLVFVNSDALPEPGSVRKLISMAGEDNGIGCVSACPVFERGGGLFQDTLGLMWSAHNLVSLRLNHAGLSNHSSDELLLVRRAMVSKLPTKLVNDGAYLGGLATSRGYRVRFCEGAKVRIAVPSRVHELVGQRRRIIFGHIQVWKQLGSAPRTMESLLFTRPCLGIGLLVSLLSRRPKSAIALPVVATCELVSAFFAVFDWAFSSDRHFVWRRYEK